MSITPQRSPFKQGPCGPDMERRQLVHEVPAGSWGSAGKLTADK
jgi:hypothetical protein